MQSELTLNTSSMIIFIGRRPQTYREHDSSISTNNLFMVMLPSL